LISELKFQKIKHHANEIKKIYSDIKPEIETRLDEFSKVWVKGSNRDLFIELAFCLLTPQSGARNSWKSINNLLEKKLLFNGNFNDISEELKLVRFRNNKTRYIIEAREKFSGRSNSLRVLLDEFDSIFGKREWLVKNVKGYGYKEASHFLRNIGFGQGIAILDRHILRNMALLEIIDEIPKSISSKLYIDFEIRLHTFSKMLKIPMSHLDFVLWYKETGDIFK